jgi:RES domain-containing protein
MAITIYRVCRRIYASLNVEGARRVVGRWNSPIVAIATIIPTKSIMAIQEPSINLSK